MICRKFLEYDINKFSSTLLISPDPVNTIRGEPTTVNQNNCNSFLLTLLWAELHLDIATYGQGESWGQ